MGTLGGVASSVSCLVPFVLGEIQSRRLSMRCGSPAALVAFCTGLWVWHPGPGQGLEAADCEEKKWDLASVDLWNMRVSEPTQILHSWGRSAGPVQRRPTT